MAGGLKEIFSFVWGKINCDCICDVLILIFCIITPDSFFFFHKMLNLQFLSLCPLLSTSQKHVERNPPSLRLEFLFMKFYVLPQKRFFRMKDSEKGEGMRGGRGKGEKKGF